MQNYFAQQNQRLDVDELLIVGVRRVFNFYNLFIMIIAIILFSIAVVIAVWSITVSNITKSDIWLLCLIFSVFCVIIGIAIINLTPTNKDVREGKAHYIEQNHIEVVNDDTVNNYKTYEIVWIENSK